MATANQIQQLYIAYFSRPADSAGLNQWLAFNGSLEEIANSFGTSPEFTKVFAPLSVEQQVNQLYVNLFSRNGNTLELQEWTAQVVNGNITIAQLGLKISNGARGSDLIAMNNKIISATSFTNATRIDANALLEYSGDLAIELTVPFLAPITAASGPASAGQVATAINNLPPVGSIGVLSSSASSITEGGTVIFTIATALAEGSALTYTLGGVSAADVVGGVLTGTVLVNSQGDATVPVTLAEDALVEVGEVLTITVPNVIARPEGSNLVPVIDTTIVNLQVNPSATAVNEGGELTFFITSTNLPSGTLVSYDLSSSNPNFTSADVSNAPLSGTVTLDSSRRAEVKFNISSDLSTEGPEAVDFVAFYGSVFASTTAGINDTSVSPPVITQAVLTTDQDISGLNIASPTTLPFTYFANEETLGQSDQLSRAPGSTAAATLNVGTRGSFNLRNFSTNDIETLEILPSGEESWHEGFVDLQAAIGLLNINVSQSALDFLRFNDIQSAQGLSTDITDSFSTFEYNFDVAALLGNTDVVSVCIEETPIDASTGEAVGFIFTQSPFNNAADLETLLLTSKGAITNVVDELRVGEDLSTLVIDGNASLEITTDLGLFNGNSRINLIDASSLGSVVNPNNLSLSYTSVLGDVVNNSVADVTVLGATGDNLLVLGSQAPNNPTDFFVRTQAGNDTVTTGDGEDSIDVGEGNNSVISNAGNDTIIAGAGNDFINAGAGNDVINAGNGLNSVNGGYGNDSIITGDDNDLIVGDQGVQAGIGSVLGNGNDTIRSGGGADSVFAGSGANLVESGNGNDWVWLGEIINGTPVGDTFANTVLLGEGNDLLEIDTNSLTVSDSINGGAGIDTINLHNGGTLLRSETLRVSRIEALDLVGIGDYSIILSEELIATADDDAGTHIFSVLTSGDAAGNVTLDLSYLKPVVLGTSTELLSIRYSGQADTNTERVIIRDGLISDQTRLAYGEAANDTDETHADVMQIVDSADVTKDDLVFVTGLEVIELASSVNGPQTFSFDFRNMTAAEFNSLVGDGDDVLIIRATPLLAGAVSQLNVDLTGATFNTTRIIIEQSADLNVSVVGGTPVIRTALFYTPNPDNLLGTNFSDTFTAYQLADVQVADNANGFGSIDTLDLRFAVSNSGASLFNQLNQTNIDSIEIFRFNPAAVNQAVQFNGIGGGLVGLSSIFTSGGADFLTNIERSLFIDSGAGNDTISGGSDSILSALAPLTVASGLGDDSITTYFGNDSINAGNGDNTVSAGNGNNTVLALEGNDSIDTGIGADRINAGDGNNTVSTSSGNDSVITGIGNDSINTAIGTEPDNDTVNSGAGNDTVLVGLGNDSVVAGEGDDVIILSSTWDSAEFEVEEFFPGGLSNGDSINGGLGNDSLLFAVDVSTVVAPNLAGQFGLANVENIVVTAVDDNLRITLARQVAIQAGGTINVVLTDGDFLSSNGVLDASAFTSGERLVAGLTDIEGESSVIGGAGNDHLFTVGAPNSPTTVPFENSEVEGDYVYTGLGGADTINLINDVFDFEAVGYQTANDGGNAGNGSRDSADLITGFRQARESVGPFTDIEDLVYIGGSLKDDVLDNAGVAAGTNLSFVFNSAVNFSGATDNDGLVIGNGVSDALLSDPTGIANRINGFGITSTVGKGGLVVVQGATESALYTFVENGFALDNVSSDELFRLGTFAGEVYLGGIEVTSGNLITTFSAGYDSANFVFA